MAEYPAFDLEIHAYKVHHVQKEVNTTEVRIIPR